MTAIGNAVKPTRRPGELGVHSVDRFHFAVPDLAVAKTGDQPHPVFSLVRKDVLDNLEAFLRSGGRKIDAWYASLATVEVSFDDEADAFRNINTLEELGKA